MNTDFILNKADYAKKLANKPNKQMNVAQKVKLIESVSNSSQSLTLEVLTLKDMTDLLTELQTNAPEYAKATLKAQLQVIDFVKSPLLVDTTLDTLMLNMDCASKHTEDPKNENDVHEAFLFMIQNYILFLNARLKLEFSRNNEEAGRLYEEAGQMLSKSVKNVAIMAMSTEIAEKVKDNLVIKNVLTQDAFESLDYEFRKNYKTLYNIISKFDKYHDTIGSSKIIADIIKQYAPAIAENTYAQELKNKNNSIEKVRTKLEQQPLFLSNKSTTYTILGLGCLTILLRWIWYGLYSMGSAVISWFVDDYVATDHTGWFFPHLCWVLGIAAVAEGISIIVSYSKRQTINEEIELAEQEYNEKVNERNKFEKSLKEMANKFK